MNRKDLEDFKIEVGEASYDIIMKILDMLAKKPIANESLVYSLFKVASIIAVDGGCDKANFIKLASIAYNEEQSIHQMTHKTPSQFN